LNNSNTRNPVTNNLHNLPEDPTGFIYRTYSAAEGAVTHFDDIIISPVEVQVKESLAILEEILSEEYR
jgi:hypothetical protein